MAEIRDEYTSISHKSEGLYKDKGSRFISMAYPVESEEEIKSILDSLRKEYHDARHHCYAWRVGCNGEKFRANDDGEPSGSSGRPILGQIDSRSLSDVLVVVVRYFGGIKLGVPGLIRAYKSAAADALDQAESVTKTACREYEIHFGYLSMNQVMKVLKDMNLPQTNQNFGEHCSLRVSIRLSAEDDFVARFEKIPDCTIKLAE